jgi:tetratricopeptide (TPR) repeat protein
MNNLAMVLRDQGNLEEARKLFDEMLQHQRQRLDREHPHALATMNNLALLLEDQGRPDEALKQYEEALKLQRQILGPEHADGLTTMHNLARLLGEHGRFKEARPLFEETLQRKRRVLRAGHPELLRTVSSFAWMLAAASDPEARDPQRALELAKELVQYSPENGNYWTILGVAHYRAGAWTDAIAALEKSEATESGKHLPSINFFLAMAHWQRGEKEESRRCYRTGIGQMDKTKTDGPDSLRFRAEAAQLLGLSSPSGAVTNP